MGRFLDWVDDQLTPESVDRNDTLKVAFSRPMLNLLALTALAYPVLSVTFQWLSGYAIGFGGEAIIPEGMVLDRFKIGVILLLPTSLLAVCVMFSMHSPF